VVGGGWAYPFDVQTRTYHYAATVPNVVCTTFAAEALLDAFEQWPDRPDRDLALAEHAARFAVRALFATVDGQPRFGYLPGHTELIHNGNLLAARLVVRTGLALGDDTLVDLARSCAMTSVRAVSAEGALSYGEGGRLDWVDGHHTGFAIDSLADIGARLGDRHLTEVARRMADYYRRALFGSDADALARPGRRWPLDVIAGAQGITTFARLGTSNDVAFAARIADRTAMLLRAPDGTYRYQRGRLHTKRVRYARWSDAPMALGLALLGARLNVVDSRLQQDAEVGRKSEATR
jgi:hypothetical protein